MIADLVNQNIVEGVIPAEWEHSTIVNYCEGIFNNYKGLEVANQS